ncbi:hypothetical protein MASR1M36_20730 [Candidatus Cloacimonadaceae bacterium]
MKTVSAILIAVCCLLTANLYSFFHLASGLYLCKVKVGEQEKVSKFTILK